MTETDVTATRTGSLFLIHPNRPVTWWQEVATRESEA